MAKKKLPRGPRQIEQMSKEDISKSFKVVVETLQQLEEKFDDVGYYLDDKIKKTDKRVSDIEEVNADQQKDIEELKKQRKVADKQVSDLEDWSIELDDKIGAIRKQISKNENDLDKKLAGYEKQQKDAGDRLARVEKKASMLINVAARSASSKASVAGQQQSGEGKTISALSSSMNIIATSLGIMNKSLSKVTGLKAPTGGAQQIQAPLPSAAVPSDGKKQDNDGIFSLLKGLFTNPAVTAALAGIVYAVLPKETQEGIKALLGGFASGIEKGFGENEEAGLGSFNTALKAAGIAIATYFGAKMLTGIADAITTVLKVTRIIGGGKLGRGAAIVGGIAAVGTAAYVWNKKKDGEEEGGPETAGPEGGVAPEAKPAPAGTPSPAAGGAPARKQEQKPVGKPGAAASAEPPKNQNVPTGGRFGSKEQFHSTMYPWAEYASKKLGGNVPPMAIMGQWAGESGNGQNLPADFNYAGIKAGSKYKKGDYVLTEERYTDAQLRRAQSSGESLVGVIGPTDKIRKRGRDVTIDEWYGKGAWDAARAAGQNWVQVKSYFAKFDSPQDFADSYVEFLKNPRYAKALAAGDAASFGFEIAKAGYATASADKYSAKVASYSAPGGATGTMMAAAPSTGADMNNNSQNVKHMQRPGASSTQVAAIDGSKTAGGVGGSSQQAQAPIPTPIASRGSLNIGTKHSTAYA